MTALTEDVGTSKTGYLLQDPKHKTRREERRESLSLPAEGGRQRYRPIPGHTPFQASESGQRVNWSLSGTRGRGNGPDLIYS